MLQTGNVSKRCAGYVEMKSTSPGRTAAVHRYEHRYRIFRIALHEEGWTRCFYCGAPADTVDHQPPLSRVCDYEALGLANERYVKVLACRECNTLLMDSLQDTLIDRHDELKIRLRKKYDRYMRLPNWTEDQLDEMGTLMRKEIRRSMRLKGAVAERIEFTKGLGDYMVLFEIEEMLS